MRKISAAVLILLFILAASGNVAAQGVSAPDYQDLDLLIMRPDDETRLKWIEEYENAPKAWIDPEIERRLTLAQDEPGAASMSLLSRIRYVPSERNQGNCGNCWVWPGTGIMEIALNVQNGIEDRLSIQLLNSCKTDRFACCGGNIYEFASWYAGKGFAVPWSNTNGFFQDGVKKCSDNVPAVSCGSISTVPNYPITSIQAVTIPTQGVGQATAIANIKNVLNQNKGVFFSFALATQSHWNAFYDFWNNQPESAVWNPDPYCGYTWVPLEGGSHAVLIVGYDDNDWIALNSWGTANGGRPNGLFRIPINMNYDCTYYDSGQGRYFYSRGFATLNVTFNPPPVQKPNLTPYKPWDWTDKVIVSKYSQAKTDSSPFYYTDSLFLNWALINNGGMAVSKRFWIDIYVDDVVKGSWYWDNLDPGLALVLMDLWIGQLSPGNHTIKLVVDSTNTIDESSEGDNVYIKTIMVIGPPNLTPYKPWDWSDKVIVSKYSQAKTDSSPFYYTDSLFLNWALINNGGMAVSTRFWIEISLDDVLKGSWYWDNLGPRAGTCSHDLWIGQLSPGTHTIKFVVDSTNTIGESNEGDNICIKTITVIGPPNLTPYKPWDWSDKVIVSKYSQAKTDSSPFLYTDPLFVNWALINNGGMPVSTRFWTEIYVDEVLKGSWYWDYLEAGMQLVLYDLWIGQLSPGGHTIKMVVDPTGAVGEFNEGDNEYVKAITVSGSTSGPDLTGELTSVKQSCRNTQKGPSCRITGSLLIRNIGTQAVSSSSVQFFLSDHQDHIEGTPIKTSSLGKVSAGASKAIRLNISLSGGETASGKYLIAVIDPANSVMEINEGNNVIVFGPIP